MDRQHCIGGTRSCQNHAFIHLESYRSPTVPSLENDVTPRQEAQTQTRASCTRGKPTSVQTCGKHSIPHRPVIFIRRGAPRPMTNSNDIVNRPEPRRPGNARGWMNGTSACHTRTGAPTLLPGLTGQTATNSLTQGHYLFWPTPGRFRPLAHPHSPILWRRAEVTRHHPNVQARHSMAEHKQVNLLRPLTRFQRSTEAGYDHTYPLRFNVRQMREARNPLSQNLPPPPKPCTIPYPTCHVHHRRQPP